MIHWGSITHLTLDHVSGTKHKTPTWYTSYCLCELPGGCLHVPVALSEQCDFLPSFLKPISALHLCSNTLTALHCSGWVSSLEYGDGPPCPLLSSTFKTVLSPTNCCLKSATLNNCFFFTCHDFIDSPHILFWWLFSRTWLRLKPWVFT